MRAGPVAVVVVVLLLCAGVAFAQFGPGVMGDAESLARSGSGIAVPTGATSGVMNPATLPMLYRIPPKLPAGELTGALPVDPLAPAFSAAAARISRDWLTVEEASPWDYTFMGAHDGDRLAMGTPLLTLPGAAHARPVEVLQVNIESRFVTIDQDFLEDLSFDWALGGVGMVSFARDIGDDFDLDTANATWGRPGDSMAWAKGCAELFDEEDFHYVSSGIMLKPAIAFDDTAISTGATLAYNDLGQADTGWTLDLALAANRGVKILSRPMILSGGVVARNVIDEFDQWGDWGSRLDVGLALSDPIFRLTLDATDVLDDTGFPDQPDFGGRSFSSSLEVKAGNTTIIGGIREDEKPTFGIAQNIPIDAKVQVLGKIPMLRAAFGRSDFETRVELMIFITPRILNPE